FDPGKFFPEGGKERESFGNLIGDGVIFNLGAQRHKRVCTEVGSAATDVMSGAAEKIGIRLRFTGGKGPKRFGSVRAEEADISAKVSFVAAVATFLAEGAGDNGG